MNRYLRAPTLIIWLTTLWVALWADLTVGNVVGGLVVAFVVVGVARPTGVTGLERTYFRPLSALVYAGYFLVQLVKSNLVVAWEIVTPRLRINRAIIAVPMHSSSAGVVTLVANSVTLTPGTVTVDVAEALVPRPDGAAHRDGSRAAAPSVSHRDGSDRDEVVQRTLFIHVLHFIDVESVRLDVLRLERLAIKAFGSRDELPLVEADLAALASSRKRHVS